MDRNNKYTTMQRTLYDRETDRMHQDHSVHNSNPDYWSVLLGPITSNKERWTGKRALDFGSGWGRNVKHMLDLADWAEVVGADISQGNCDNAKRTTTSTKPHQYYVTDGVSLNETSGKDMGKFDFIMSTIVLQHICVYDIRKSILTSMYEKLNDGGMISIQIGLDETHQKEGFIHYYTNHLDAKTTNSGCDTLVEDRNYLIKDLEDIGFKDITYQIRQPWSDRHHKEWIYLYANK